MENKDIKDLKNQEDVNPTTQLDKLVKNTEDENLPGTNGTGSNRPVPTSGSVIIKDDDKKE